VGAYCLFDAVKCGHAFLYGLRQNRITRTIEIPLAAERSFDVGRSCVVDQILIEGVSCGAVHFIQRDRFFGIECEFAASVYEGRI
jgi:hypothetical protein